MTHAQLREEIKLAMKNHDEVRLLVMRGLLSAGTNELVASGRKPTDELTEEELASIIRRGVKQRKDSIEQFTKGGREDLVEKESAELAVLASLLPPEMSREDIEKMVRVKMAELGVTDNTKSGILTGAVMKELKGKADGAVVKNMIEELLG